MNENSKKLTLRSEQIKRHDEDGTETDSESIFEKEKQRRPILGY